MAGPDPPPVLDYRQRETRRRTSARDRGVLLPAACVSGLIAIGLFAGLIDLLIVTWPDFGAALLAVPILLGVAAFGTVAITGFRVATGRLAESDPRPSPLP